MLNEASTFTCPVCRFAGLSEAPYDTFNCASYSICPCCGTEFGYDDASAAHDALRAKWVDGGMHWWSPNVEPPPGWDPRKQLGDV